MLSSTSFAGQAFPAPAAKRILSTSRYALRNGCGVLCATILLFLASSLPASAQRGVAISYLADPSASLTIEQVSSPKQEVHYRGYVPSFMAFSQLPADFNGAVWLRIILDSSFEKPVNALRVDLSAFLPGLTRLFIPKPDKTFDVMESRSPRVAFTLAESAPFPDVLYARIDGTPGLWFRPFLGSVDNSPKNLPLHFILAGLFGLAMLVLLIQYIRKAEEWRLWAAITTGCGIVSAILPPSPAAGAVHVPLMVVGMLMPGLILLFFTHTVRHLFDSPKTMPGYDKILVLLYLISGGIALLPLIPGFLWTARYLPFAVITLLPLLPVTMVAMSRSLRGCSAFFCAILLPIIGVAASAWELTATTTPLLSGSGGLWGLGLGLLILSFASPSNAKTEATDEEDVFDSLNRVQGLVLHKEYTEPSSPSPIPVDPPIAPEITYGGVFTPEDDPTRQSNFQQEAVSAEIPQAEDFPDIDLFGSDAGSEETPLPIPESALPVPEMVHIETDAQLTPDIAAIVLQAMRPTKPETAGTTPPTALEPAVSLPSAQVEIREPVAELAESSILTLEGYETPGNVSEVESITPNDNGMLYTATERRQNRRILFNLPLLIKTVYDTLAPLAEKKNLGLTWFIAPQTGRLFEGEADMLGSALSLLLRDMVGSVDQGNVRLNVRRLPDSTQPGHLVFTVVEWDAKQTEYGRNITGLAEAWALAEKTGGIFSVEHTPGSGTTVIFSSVFTAADATKTSEAAEAITPRPLPFTNAAREFPPSAKAVKEVLPTTDITNEPPTTTKEVENLPTDSVSTQKIQMFVDHADIVMSEAFSGNLPTLTTQTLIPSGIDADNLGNHQESRREPYQLIVADIATSSRTRTASVLARPPYTVLECASPADAYTLYLHHPSALVVMSADMPEVDITAAIKDIHADDAAHGRSPALSVVLVGYPAQAERLLQAGCSRAVMKKLMEEELPAVVQELVPPPSDVRPSSEKQPVPESTTAPPLVEQINKELTSLPPTTPKTDAPNDDERLPEPIVKSGLFTSVLPAAEPVFQTMVSSDIHNGKSDTNNSVEPSAGLGLIDMIITEVDATDETLPMPSEVGATDPKTAVPAPPTPAVSATTSASAVNATPRPKVAHKQALHVSIGKPKINTSTKAGPTKSVPTQAEEARTPSNAPSTVLPKQTPLAVAQPVKQILTEQTKQVEPVDESVPGHLASIPLPGEDDGVFKDMVPLIPGLIVELTDAMKDADKGKKEKSPLLVQQAAERVAGKAESFGLTRLERMARCVERAAAADDIEPMECVLGDLETWIVRYKEALLQLHRKSLG